MGSAQAVPILSKTTLALPVLASLCLACIVERARSSRSAGWGHDRVVVRRDRL